MPMKRHHKIMIGSFSSLVIIFMIVSGVLMYSLFVKQNLDRNSLKQEITDVNSKITELTTTIMQTQENVGSLNSKLSEIKASTSSDFSGVIEDSIVSVITIQTDVAQGTGFLITDDGYAITNAHVLVGGHQVKAINYEQQTISTVLIGYNGEFDIALLKLEGNFEELNLADSDYVQIGEKVIAIGNPLGLQFSVSEGIVSAVDREGTNGAEAYIQTDAALNPGNSGGPLINKEGRVIGINNFKVSGGENLGFALESNYIRSIVNQIAMENLETELI